MPIFKAFTKRAEQALGQVGRVRDHYLSIYSRALEAGAGTLDDFLKWGDAFSPRLRGLLEGRLERLHHHLDDLNQSLADRAVPFDRKARVGRLSLDAKGHQAGLRVVAGTSTAQSRQQTTAASRPEPVKKPKRENKTSARPGSRPSSRKTKAAGAAQAKTSGTQSSGSGRSSVERKRPSAARSRKPASPKD